jgi:O-antigen/teichoic acid export membrane protein
MKDLIKSIASKIGIDKAIVFTASSSIFGAFGSIISVILVVKCLSSVEQGFYYTFGSIVAIQIFFELGLNGIITQYVAHEASNLQWENTSSLNGETKYLSRLSSLLHFSVKWYLSFAVLLVISLMVIGTVFFTRYDTTNGAVSWFVPWIILAIGTSCNLIISPILAFLIGLGKVKEIAKIQLIQQVFRLSFVWVSLIFGAKMFVLGISSFIGALVVIIIISARYLKLLKNIWATIIVEKVNYRKEIFPYQWKIALSWISGYFIFQLFNPVLFATEGPVVAGQMGMTLAALNGILSLSLGWMTTKIPLFSGLIAQKEFNRLDNVFTRTLKQSALINIAALLLLAFFIFIIRYYNLELSGKALGNRFLTYIPMTLMMVPIFLNQLIASWATYLRCHKKEPFLVFSISGGIACSLSTILLGKYFGVIGITLGYCLITICLVPWAYFIFKTKRAEWHEPVLIS